MLTLITPTGDRPKAFELCERWVANQSYTGEYRWIVVDDGMKETEVTNPNVEYIRLEPLGKNSQARNLLAALEFVNHEDKVIVIEDDDYYGTNWLSIMNQMLEEYDLAGEQESYYWHVQTRKYKNCGNLKHASLCATGVARTGIDTLIKCCRTKPKFIDIQLWRTFTGRKILFAGNSVVGIKGLPGRAGIGGGHRTNFGKVEDPDGKVLKNLIGEDAEVYL